MVGEGRGPSVVPAHQLEMASSGPVRHGPSAGPSSAAADVGLSVSRGGPPLPPDLEASPLDPRAVGAPSTFFCPISHQILRDPVLLPTGQTYERRDIGKWLKAGNLKCPVTGLYMAPPIALVPNVALRQSIEEWCLRHMPHLLDASGKVKPDQLENESPSDFSIENVGNYADAGMVSCQSLGDGRLNQAALFESHTSPRYMHNLAIGRRRAAGSDAEAAIPWFLYFMTVVLLVTFLAEIWVNDWQFAPISTNPLLGPDSDALVAMGAKVTSRIVEDNQWWRLFSAVFLSAGVLHILGTLSAMWTFGRYLEREITSATIAMIFLISAVAGLLLSANLAPDSVTAGSSGGAFGLLGASWMEHFIDWRLYKHHLINILNLAIICAIHLVVGLLPFVDNWCNIGSFCTGALLCCSVMLTRRSGSSRWKEIGIVTAQVVCALAVLCYFVVFVLGLVLGLGTGCQWCHYLTCIPTEWWECDGVVTYPNACFITDYNNSTLRLQCPGGQSMLVPAPLEMDHENSVRLCQQQCGFQEVSSTSVIE